MAQALDGGCLGGRVRQFELDWIASDEPLAAAQLELSDRVYVDYEDVDRGFFVDGMEHRISDGNVHIIRLSIASDNGYEIPDPSALTPSDGDVFDLWYGDPWARHEAELLDRLLASRGCRW